MFRCIGRSHVAVLAFSAVRIAKRSTSTTNPKNQDESDFVDLWAEMSPSDEVSTGAAAVVAPLGIHRALIPAEDEEISRLGVSVANKRRGLSVARDGSRAVQLSSELSVAPEEGRSADGGVEGEEGGPAAENEEQPLPFDDERLAESILEMEVEGALDEAWQDTAKAHLEDVVALSEILRELKVRDICAIDVSNKTANFDFLLVGTCEGVRHMHLAAWAVQEADKKKRISKVRRQRTDQLWEIVPVGRIIVNLMQEGYREEVNIERKWAVTGNMDPLQTANAPVSEGRQVKAHGLWTLTLNLQDLEDFEVDYCKDVLMSQT